jgi:hypothetical protein
MAERKVEDLSIIEMKAFILDHFDRIEASKQSIDFLRQQIAERIKQEQEQEEAKAKAKVKTKPNDNPIKS